jgi:hypothetical protein
LSWNRNLSQDLHPVNRIGLFSLISRNQNPPSVNTVVVAIVHHPKHRGSNGPQTLDAIRKTGLPKLRIHLRKHTVFIFSSSSDSIVCFSVHCWMQLGNAADIMFGNAVANIFLTLLLSSWQNMHSVFRGTTIARFFLALSYFPYF